MAEAAADEAEATAPEAAELAEARAPEAALLAEAAAPEAAELAEAAMPEAWLASDAPADPAAPVAEARAEVRMGRAAGAESVEAAAGVGVSAVRELKFSGSLTSTVANGDSDGLSRLLGRASLLRAVPYTESVVALGAEAAGITLGASVARLGRN